MIVERFGLNKIYIIRRYERKNRALPKTFPEND